VRFEKIYFAAESPEDDSPGRKPNPKFLKDAASEFGVDLSQSFMVGDKTADLQCGWNAGVKKSILVRTGYGADLERDEPDTVANAAIVDNITAAVDWILENP
jgi:D-glycero-D-manno-heptose 1,7-bisphosphate phosphatase